MSKNIFFQWVKEFFSGCALVWFRAFIHWMLRVQAVSQTVLLLLNTSDTAYKCGSRSIDTPLTSNGLFNRLVGYKGNVIYCHGY